MQTYPNPDVEMDGSDSEYSDVGSETSETSESSSESSDSEDESYEERLFVGLIHTILLNITWPGSGWTLPFNAPGACWDDREGVVRAVKRSLEEHGLPQSPEQRAELERMLRESPEWFRDGFERGGV